MFYYWKTQSAKNVKNLSNLTICAKNTFAIIKNLLACIYLQLTVVALEYK